LANDKPIDILSYIQKLNSFPNAYVTQRIMLTISMSTMSQERLNGLALLSIEEEMLNELIMTI